MVEWAAAEWLRLAELEYVDAQRATDRRRYQRALDSLRAASRFAEWVSTRPDARHRGQGNGVRQVR